MDNFLNNLNTDITCSIFILFALLFGVYLIFKKEIKTRYYRHTHRSKDTPTLTTEHPNCNLRQKKPDWVVNEVIRLKALMPNNGARKIAEVFNRIHSQKRGMTICKSTAHNFIAKNKHAIFLLRKNIKRIRPKSLPKNVIWSLDLTTVTDDKKRQHITFGIVDNGTRACLLLRKLTTKTSINLLRNLLDAIELYGRPKIIRMDNEAVFKSRIFRFGFWLLRIKLQYTEVACPWQNGRIERFFGTLKQHIRKIVITEDTLEQRLYEFRAFYNHVRTHSNLNGLTPAERWNGNTRSTQYIAYYFEAWQGVMSGFYLHPK